MIKAGIAIFAAFAMLAAFSTAFAQEGNAPEAQANPATKLGNGLGNMLTGWMELPRQIGEVSKEQNAFAGITYGTAKGAVYTVGRTAAGVLDTATFMFPSYDRPIMEPNYTL